MQEETKQSFKVRIEYIDPFGTKMSGESSIEYNPENSPAEELIILFEQAFEACGFNCKAILDYYQGEKV